MDFKYEYILETGAGNKTSSFKFCSHFLSKTGKELNTDETVNTVYTPRISSLKHYKFHVVQTH